MRNRRWEKQSTRRRQEQEYRDKIPTRATKRIDPTETALINAPIRETKELVPTSFTRPDIVVPAVGVSRREKREIKSNPSLIILACALFAVTVGVNASVAWEKGTAVEAKAMMAAFGMIFEGMLFCLPSRALALWQQRFWLRSVICCVVTGLLFGSGLMASLSFASENFQDTAINRAERITPAVSDAQRRLDTLSASRKDECQKRGDRCRQLEKEEQQALEALRQAREKVSDAADPQITAAAKLIAWVTLDRFQPSADDLAMLRLLLLTLLPQLGGLVLMVAKGRPQSFNLQIDMANRPG